MKHNLSLKVFLLYPELSWNSGLRNKFPDHSISKMEIFFRKNGNPRSILWYPCRYILKIYFFRSYQGLIFSINSLKWLSSRHLFNFLWICFWGVLRIFWFRFITSCHQAWFQNRPTQDVQRNMTVARRIEDRLVIFEIINVINVWTWSTILKLIITKYS